MSRRLLHVAYYVLVAICYGVAYAALRESSLINKLASVFNWLPEGALRFGCLLLMPFRYWPSLFFGEAMALGFSNYFRCLDEQGLTWVLVNSLPRALEVMPVVWLLRKLVPDIKDVFIRKTPQLLTCIASASALSALFGWLSYSLMRPLPPGEYRLSFGAYFGQVFMGYYLAMLSFIPLVLWLAQRVRHAQADKRQARRDFVRFARSYRWLGPAALVVVNGLMLLLGIYGGRAGQPWAVVGILATLMPVTWSYGWSATAVVGAAANIVVVSIMPTYNDVSTLSVQVVLMMFLTTLLMFAAKTSEAAHFKEEEKEALRHARRTYLLTEHQRLTSATHMEDVLDEARLATTRLIQCARPFLPAPMLAEHHRQFQSLHDRYQRLLLGLSPCDWWELGNPDGLLVSALRAEGIGFDVLNMPKYAHLLPLSTEMNIAIKQLTCEAALHLLDCAPNDRMSLDIGIKKHDDCIAINIVLETTGLPTGLTDESYERLMVGMGALGLNEQGLRERVRLYGGDVNVTCPSEDETRVAIQLIERPWQMII